MADLRSELEANVKTIDRALNDPELSGSEIASLVRERRITLSELDGLTSQKAGSLTDELKEKRAKRRAGLTAKAATPSG